RNVVRHVPVAAAAADLAHETVQDLRALAGVRHFGVELHAVEAPRLVGPGGDPAGLGGGHQLEFGGELGPLLAVGPPHPQHPAALGGVVILDPIEEPGVAARPHLGVAELTHAARLDPATELLRHSLHAVADAEDRHAGVEDRARRPPGRLL